jgi:hypothetical protein
MPLPSSLSARLLKNCTQVQSLVEDMEHAKTDLAGGPDVLFLVNELAVLCETLFDTHASDAARTGDARAVTYRREHETFLSEYSGFAEEVRASNGELSDEFFEFLQRGTITIKPHAA